MRKKVATKAVRTLFRDSGDWAGFSHKKGAVSLGKGLGVEAELMTVAKGNLFIFVRGCLTIGRRWQ